MGEQLGASRLGEDYSKRSDNGHTHRTIFVAPWLSLNGTDLKK